MPVVQSWTDKQTKARWLQVSEKEVGSFWRLKTEGVVYCDGVVGSRMYPYVTFVTCPNTFTHLKPKICLNNILTFCLHLT
jgi:hypothetical protein